MAPSEEEQGYDLMVLAYGPTFLAPDRGDFGYAEVPGYKVAGYGAFLRNHLDVIERYDQIALIDDDIETDHRGLARAFELGRAHDLRLWQPSLSWDSYFSHAALLFHPASAPVRNINFVEMMCPFFKRTALVEVADLFQIGAETGIDILWSNVLGEDIGKVAVLDGVSVKHTRPVGTKKIVNGFVDDYSVYIEKLMSEFDMTYDGVIAPISPSAEGGNKSVVLTNYIRSVLVGAGFFITPMDKKEFLYRWGSSLKRLALANRKISGDRNFILKRARELAAGTANSGE